MLHRGTLNVGPRACILTKGVISYSLPQFGDRDTTTVCLSFKVQNREQRIDVTSIYMPIEDQLPTNMVEQIWNFCRDEKLPLIVACDTNAQLPLCNDMNHRDQLLSEFLATSDLEVANPWNEATFCVGNIQTIIDITLMSRSLSRDVCCRHVSCDDSMSDHRMIRFAVKSDKPGAGMSRLIGSFMLMSWKNPSDYGLVWLKHLRLLRGSWRYWTPQ